VVKFTLSCGSWVTFVCRGYNHQTQDGSGFTLIRRNKFTPKQHGAPWFTLPCLTPGQTKHVNGTSKIEAFYSPNFKLSKSRIVLDILDASNRVAVEVVESPEDLTKRSLHIDTDTKPSYIDTLHLVRFVDSEDWPSQESPSSIIRLKRKSHKVPFYVTSQVDDGNASDAYDSSSIDSTREGDSELDGSDHSVAASDGHVHSATRFEISAGTEEHDLGSTNLEYDDEDEDGGEEPASKKQRLETSGTLHFLDALVDAATFQMSIDRVRTSSSPALVEKKHSIPLEQNAVTPVYKYQVFNSQYLPPLLPLHLTHFYSSKPWHTMHPSEISNMPAPFARTTFT